MTILTKNGMTAAELRSVAEKLTRSAASKKSRKNKYNAIRTMIGDLRFDSKKEAECWTYLKARERAGEICDLRRQVKFELRAATGASVAGVKICTYIADFEYFDKKLNKVVVADAKGVKTALFNLKMKLMKANHGIEVELM